MIRVLLGETPGISTRETRAPWSWVLPSRERSTQAQVCILASPAEAVQPEASDSGSPCPSKPQPPLSMGRAWHLPCKAVLHVKLNKTARYLPRHQALCLADKKDGSDKIITTNICRASLVAQWLRIRLPMQETRVRALVREDPTCRGATKPVRHNY